MKTAIDKNGDKLEIHDNIIMPEPEGDDEWRHSFAAWIIEINDDNIVVEDGDNDCWTIHPSRVELDTGFN